MSCKGYTESRFVYKLIVFESGVEKITTDACLTVVSEKRVSFHDSEHVFAEIKSTLIEDVVQYFDVVISNTGVSCYAWARELVGDHSLHKIPYYVSVCNVVSVSEPVSEPYSYNVCG